METNLTSIFGNEISVYAQNRQKEVQFVGFPGAHGLVGIDMGSRGYQFIITGRLRCSGRTYETARVELQEKIDAIEYYILVGGACDFTFKGTIYHNVVLLTFNLIPDRTGKAFFYTSQKEIFVDFVCHGHSLF